MKLTESTSRRDADTRHFETFDDIPSLEKPVIVRPETLHAFKELPKEALYTGEAIQAVNIDGCEHGDPIKLPNGEEVCPVRLKANENKIYFATPEIFIRQPRQPRSYFDPEKMYELACTIATHGQIDPIHVVPVVCSDGVCRFLIIDGERRFRVIHNLGLPYIKFTVDWGSDEDEIFERSYTLNAKEPHTIFEMSDAYTRMLALRKKKGMSQAEAIKDIAKSVGKNEGHIREYLTYQRIDPDVRLGLGNVMTPSASKEFVRAISTSKGGIDQHGLAAKITENPNLFATRGTGVGRVTLSAVRRTIRDQLEETGSITAEDRRDIEAGDALGKFSQAAYLMRQALNIIERREDLVDPMIQRLQDRRKGKPADVLIEEIEMIMEGCRTWYEKVLKPGQKVPSLEKPVGAPRFKDQLEDRIRRLDGDKFKEKLARILAAASDSEEETPVTAQKIVEILADRGTSTDVLTVVGNLNHMFEPLREMDFELDIHEIRRRGGGKARTVDGRAYLQKVNAYRLRWNDGALARFKLDARLK